MLSEELLIENIENGYIKKTYNYGVLTMVEYYNDNNELHSPTEKEGKWKPAVIKYHPYSNDISCKIWYKNGLKHSFPGINGMEPGEIFYSIGKRFAYQALWYKDGKLHSPSSGFPQNEKVYKPAVITYCDAFKIKSKQWYKDGNLHSFKSYYCKPRKPAEIIYNNKTYKSMSWYYKGKLHRDGHAPAVIEYDNNGSVCKAMFYTHGENISKKEKIKDLIFYL